MSEPTASHRRNHKKPRTSKWRKDGRNTRQVVFLPPGSGVQYSIGSQYHDSRNTNAEQSSSTQQPVRFPPQQYRSASSKARFNSKAHRKNKLKAERQLRSRNILAAPTRTPYVRTYTKYFLNKVLAVDPPATTPQIVVFDILYENAKLFFTKLNCPKEVTDLVLTSGGDFKPAFKVSFINTINVIAQAEYEKDPLDVEPPTVRGLFTYTPWARGQGVPAAVLRELVVAEKSNQAAKMSMAEKLRVALSELAAVSPAESGLRLTPPATPPPTMDDHMSDKNLAQQHLDAENWHRTGLALAQRVLDAEAESTRLRAAQSVSASVSTGVVVCGFTAPQHLVTVAKLTGCSHSYLHPTLLSRKFRASEHAVVLDFESCDVWMGKGGASNVRTTVPLECSLVIINVYRNIVGEFSSPCTVAYSYGKLREEQGIQMGMTGLSLPTGRSNNVVETVAKEYDRITQAMLGFMKLAFGDTYWEVPCYAKGKKTEVECLKYLGFDSLAVVVKDMCPQGSRTPQFPFTNDGLGPGNNWLKHGKSTAGVGMCLTHTSMNALPHYHCALQDCRSYCLALWQHWQGQRDPTGQRANSQRLSAVAQSSTAQFPFAAARNTATSTNGSQHAAQTSASGSQRVFSAVAQNSTSGSQHVPFAAARNSAIGSQRAQTSKSGSQLVSSAAARTSTSGYQLAPCVAGAGPAQEPPDWNIPNSHWAVATPFYHFISVARTFDHKQVPICDVFGRNCASVRDAEIFVRVRQLVKEGGGLKENVCVTLGRGAFGSVHPCFRSGVWGDIAPQENSRNDPPLVIKIANRPMRCQEIAIHVRAKHQCIVECIEHGDASPEGCSSPTPYLVLHMMGTTLHSYENTIMRRPLKACDLKLVYESLRDAFNYLHQHLGVVHLDVHTNNILVDHNGHCLTKVCLSDFGRARRMSSTVASSAHGSETTPPRANDMLVTYPKEIYNYGNVGPHTDLFSYTVMGLQLFVGQQVFRGVQPEFQRKGYFETYGGLMSLISDRLIASGWSKRPVWGKKTWKEPLKVLEDIINSRDYEGDRKGYTIDQACKALLFFVGKMEDE